MGWLHAAGTCDSNISPYVLVFYLGLLLQDFLEACPLMSTVHNVVADTYFMCSNLKFAQYQNVFKKVVLCEIFVAWQLKSASSCIQCVSRQNAVLQIYIKQWLTVIVPMTLPAVITGCDLVSRKLCIHMILGSLVHSAQSRQYRSVCNLLIQPNQCHF